MSKFLSLIKGAAKSNTIQFNGVILAIWAAVMNTDLVQSNPDILAILAGVQSFVNIVIRFKTSKPLDER